MPSRDSEVKTARMNKETWEEVKKLMESEGMTFSGVIKMLVDESERVHPKNKAKTAEGVPHKSEASDYVSDETRKDVEQMCHLSGVSTVYFNDEVCRLFNEGKIEFDCMKLKSKGEYDLSYLLDVCHRINADPQEMINKLANSLVRR